MQAGTNLSLIWHSSGHDLAPGFSELQNYVPCVTTWEKRAQTHALASLLFKLYFIKSCPEVSDLMQIKSPAFYELAKHEQEKWRLFTFSPMSRSSQELGDRRVSFTLSHWRISRRMAPINHVGVVTLPLYEVRCGHSAPAIFLQKRLALFLSPPAVLLEEILNYLT